MNIGRRLQVAQGVGARLHGLERMNTEKCSKSSRLYFDVAEWPRTSYGNFSIFYLYHNA